MVEKNTLHEHWVIVLSQNSLYTLCVTAKVNQTPIMQSSVKQKGWLDLSNCSGDLQHSLDQAVNIVQYII